MPEPPGGRGQKSIFAFPGFKKYIQVKGVLHEVVPPALDDFDAKHPLLCRWGCGERFSRGAAKANHEKHCKKQCRAPEAPRAQAEEVEMEDTVPAVPALLAVPAVPAVPAAPPAVPNNEPLPDSMECHRARLRPRVPAGGPAAKKPRGLGKGAQTRRRRTTEEKARLMDEVKDFMDDGHTLVEAAEKFEMPIPNLSKWKKQAAGGPCTREQ